MGRLVEGQNPPDLVEHGVIGQNVFQGGAAQRSFPADAVFLQNGTDPAHELDAVGSTVGGFHRFVVHLDVVTLGQLLNLFGGQFGIPQGSSQQRFGKLFGQFKDTCFGVHVLILGQRVGESVQVPQYGHPGTAVFLTVKGTLAQSLQKAGVFAHGVVPVAGAVLKIPLGEDQPFQKCAVGGGFGFFAPGGLVRRIQTGVEPGLVGENGVSLFAQQVPTDGVTGIQIGMAAVYPHRPGMIRGKGVVRQEHFRHRAIMSLLHDAFHQLNSTAFLLVLFSLCRGQLFEFFVG